MAVQRMQVNINLKNENNLLNKLNLSTLSYPAG